MVTGEIQVPPGILVRPEGFHLFPPAWGVGVREQDRVWVPVAAFAIDHPQGLVLVDTGWPREIATAPTRVLGTFVGRFARVRMHPGQEVPAQLRAVGLDPQRVRYVVVSHLSMDHVSGLEPFCGAIVLLGEGEYRAHWRRRWYVTDLKHFYRRACDVREVAYSRAPAVPPFQAAVDLFGDGLVLLLATPGHTPGHQAVLVRLASRPVLLALDASPLARNYREGRLMGLVHDGKRARESLNAIRAFADAHPDALIIPAHDAEVFAGLALAPAYYE